jgi:hypothetical protein
MMPCIGLWRRSGGPAFAGAQSVPAGAVKLIEGPLQAPTPAIVAVPVPRFGGSAFPGGRQAQRARPDACHRGVRLLVSPAPVRLPGGVDGAAMDLQRRGRTSSHHAPNVQGDASVTRGYGCRCRRDVDLPRRALHLLARMRSRDQETRALAAGGRLCLSNGLPGYLRR